jgi:hypothetical protein
MTQILQRTRGTAAAILCALSVVCTSAAAVHAQTPPSPDPARLAAAEELIQIQGGIEQARKGLTQMTAAMVAEVRRTSPAEADGLEAFMKTYVSADSPKVTAFFEDVKKASVEFYAERCTLEELRAMSEFLKTPQGRKFIELAPEATTIIAPRFVRFQQSLIADVRAAAARGEFKKK